MAVGRERQVVRGASRTVCASLMRHGEVPLAVNETCTKLAGTAPRRPASAKSVSLLGMNAKEEALLFY